MLLRSLWTVTAIVLTLLLVAAHRRAIADGVWDKIERALKEGEQHRAFCANNPNDDSCRPMAAYALLLLCQGQTPEGLGHCHGALRAYALEGKDLDAWLCVPTDTLQDFEQLRRLFIREAARMPEVLHRPARLLLYYSVAKAFPCPLPNIAPGAG
jgi:hypothetical protein